MHTNDVIIPFNWMKGLKKDIHCSRGTGNSTQVSCSAFYVAGVSFSRCRNAPQRRPSSPSLFPLSLSVTRTQACDRTRTVTACPCRQRIPHD